VTVHIHLTVSADHYWDIATSTSISVVYCVGE